MCYWSQRKHAEMYDLHCLSSTNTYYARMSLFCVSVSLLVTGLVSMQHFMAFIIVKQEYFQFLYGKSLIMAPVQRDPFIANFEKC